MRIVTDKDYAEDGKTVVAEHVFHLDDTLQLIHPDNPNNFISPSDYLKRLYHDNALREKAGWNAKSQHEGEKEPRTRFERLLDHMEKQPDAEAFFRRLGDNNNV